MKIETEWMTTYPEDPTRHLGFHKFKNKCGDFVFIVGAFDYKNLNRIKDQKIVFLEFEDPNRFFSEDDEFNHIKYEEYFDKIFTICPYTTKWLNKKFTNNKRVFTFFPFNENYIPKKTKKKNDVIYTGHLYGGDIMTIVKTISNFNYRFVSHSDSDYVTDRKVSYADKLKAISESKITIVKNSMELKLKHIIAINKNNEFEKNYAFKEVPNKTKLNWLDRFLPKKIVTVPQIKSRVFEAAFSRSLILCQKDNFNVIEYFFCPDEEFVYYKKGGLSKKIQEILDNFDQYSHIIDNAYKRATEEYTTKSFFNKYLKNLEIN